MTFFNPLLLFAALGIGLPILAHLLNRHKVKRTDWAAMQFLSRSIRVRSRQLRLRDLLLLLLRCMAVLLIVFALAKPSKDSAEGFVASVGQPHVGVVIALDGSYSMRYRENQTTRFAQAIEKIEMIAKDIPIGAPVSLIVLGEEHRVVARNMAYDPERFDAILQAQRPSHGRIRMETMPAALFELVQGLDAVDKQLILVTDLQAGDWADPPAWFRDAFAELNQRADTFILPIQGKADNLAITEFELFAGLLRKGTTARYSTTIHNFGSSSATNVNVKCYMGESVVDAKVIPLIPPRSAQTVSFFVPFQNAGSVELSARLEDDALVLDNIRRSVANIRDRVSVLCVEGKPLGSTLQSYTVNALSARGGDATKEEFNVRTIPVIELPNQDLSAFDVIVLSDVREITPKLSDDLLIHVREGNGLIWFGGENVKVQAWNALAKRKGGALLPAIIGEANSFRDVLGEGRPLDPVFPDHPVCRPLRSLPKDLLSETQFRTVFQVAPRPSSSVLLRLSGSDTPILLEHRIGRGHVFMFTTSANPSWNNMALTPVFPMLLQQMATYLTGREFEQARLVGHSLSLSYADKPDANDGVFEAPSQQIFRVPVREHEGDFVAYLDRAKESGFYQARVSLQSPGQPIAVNVDTRESDVRGVDPAEAQVSLAETGVTVLLSDVGVIDNVRTGQSYWRVLLMGCLGCLILESLVAANLLSGWRKRRQPSTEAQPVPKLGGA